MPTDPISDYDDEIDLRAIFQTLWKARKVILIVTLAAAVAAFAMSSFSPKQYAASAIVAITNPRYLLQFDPRIETVSADKIQVNAKAYLGLATSDAVLAQLLEAPETATLMDGTGTLEDLRAMLEAKAGTDPSLVMLTVTDTDPARAAAVANAWAELYVAYIGNVYGQNQQTQAFFESQGVARKADYDTAQRALEEFLGNNSVNKLQREIADRQTLINQYEAEQTTSRGHSLSQQLQNRRQILTGYYSELAIIEQLLDDARTLREQVQYESASTAANTGNALALLLLRSQAFAGDAGANVQLQISLAQSAEPITTADVDSLIAVLESRQVKTQVRIDTLAAQLLTDPQVSAEELSQDDPISQLIEQYSNEALALTAQLEAEQARQRELTQARDLTWETFTTVARKAEEARIATASGNGEVSLASRASVPTEKVGPKRALNTALAGMLGLMLSAFGALAMNWWRNDKADSLH